ncbi:MAG TPA: hypothetical protein VGO85_07280, partial [Caldimonas sp.]|nr:hypothetical protein [Caldimonas sp.]
DDGSSRPALELLVLLEMDMHAPRAQPRYAPTSVGALMDTTFLRAAMGDANGDRRVEPAPSPTLRRRWSHALRWVAIALKRT